MTAENDGGSGGVSTSKPSSAVENVGERLRITVEIRPEETTIVSWKRLVKDVNKVHESTTSTSVPNAPPPPIIHTNALDSRIGMEQPTETELQDASGPHRYSAVIEKIERLYMGKNSSDEEDLDDIPDDDQYDTEDSFIDDAELDEYFQVDNSATKHDGFFVNRGKLERKNELTPVAYQEPKKRRRKDMLNTSAESLDVHLPRKHVKLSKVATGKSVPFTGNTTSDTSLFLAQKDKQHEDVKYANQLIASKKKSDDTKTKSDHSMIMKKLNGEAPQVEPKHTGKQKLGASKSKNIDNSLKIISGPSAAPHHIQLDKNHFSESKAHLGKLFNSVEETSLSGRPKEKNDICGQPGSNLSRGKHPMQVGKASNTHRKDGSSGRPKGSNLEKAIKDLEKIVAESRPSPKEGQDADPSSQAVKKRLPPDVKQKLAKVARLAASHGKLSTELVDRLQSIVGHFMQLRTLKRNLRVMIDTGISAKQEKDNRFLLIKNEVTKMIKMQVPVKEIEQQAGGSDDFQNFVSHEKGAQKGKCRMGCTLEDKICELYDIYVDGLDEEMEPQIRKLYVELAQLWPNGSMDNHGIRRAICKSKERKKELNSQQKDQEIIRKKKMLLPKTDETIQEKAGASGQSLHAQVKSVADSISRGSTALNIPVSNTAMPARAPDSSTIAPSLEKQKHEKVKVSSITSLEDKRVADGTFLKKNMKKKSTESDEGQIRPDKSQKKTTSIPNKSKLTLPSAKQS